MRKKSELSAFAQETFEVVLEKNLPLIRAELQSSKVINDCQQTFARLFKRCLSLQEIGIKQPAAFIHIFYLNTCLLTDQYGLQINIFDEKSYFDQIECRQIWNIDFIMKYFQEDLVQFEKRAYKEIVGFGYPEFIKIKRKYYMFYVSMLQSLFQHEIDGIVNLEEFQNMMKYDNLKIAFGGYMDKATLLWEMEKGKSV